MEDQLELQVNSKAKIRGNDSHGSGYYCAPRGPREHKGIDLVCQGGTIIKSASDGTITRCDGIVYSDPDKSEWRYVQVTDDVGVHCRYFYVKGLDIELGLRIKKGDPIGAAQGIETLYEGITPHIHFETRISKLNYINPNEYLRNLEEVVNEPHKSPQNAET